jgi:hypothetical protein
LREAKSTTALWSRKTASGGLPPAIWVVSRSFISSAGMPWNSMVMLGCSAWNSSRSATIISTR